MSLQNRKLAWAATGVVALGALSGWAAPALFGTAGAATVASSLAPASGPVPLTTAPNYRAIVEQNQAAVVGISITGDMNVASQGEEMPFPFGEMTPFGGGDERDNPLYRFFRRGPGASGAVPLRAQGSGFIISPDGLILTNAHVVDHANVVTVKLSDHREFKAKVLGSDRASDIAVLRIDARSLPTVHLGNSDEIHVGDYVLAIGQPFGLEETATAGIVSAKARSLPGDGYVPFIQTDVAVNPGNSGGPLFDATGSVVGINSQIYSNSGGYQGVSFAIPINLARQVQEQIVKTGKVSHGRLGVAVQSVDQGLADSFNLEHPEGALISKIDPGSAAAEAGLKVGDVITEYDGTPVHDAGQLSTRINTTAPGKEATLKVWRAGKSLTLTARIRADSESQTQAANGSAAEQLGLALRPLTADECQQAGTANGLIVQGVSGPAARAGIQQGDVVLGVNGKALESVAQLREAARDHDKPLALLIQRGENRIFVPLQLG